MRHQWASEYESPELFSRVLGVSRCHNNITEGVFPWFVLFQVVEVEVPWSYENKKNKLNTPSASLNLKLRLCCAMVSKSPPSPQPKEPGNHSAAKTPWRACTLQTSAQHKPGGFWKSLSPKRTGHSKGKLWKTIISSWNFGSEIGTWVPHWSLKMAWLATCSCHPSHLGQAKGGCLHSILR